VDGVRHLPDNVTVTKVTAKVVDINLVEVAKPRENMAIIE